MTAGLETLAAALANKETTARELTEQALAGIAATNGTLNAFLALDAEGARRAAAESDRRRAAGETRSRYDGIPYAAKDNFSTAGIRTTCASDMLRGYVPPFDAAAVERLRAAGFVLVGKTNMDEFAMGSVTAAPAFGAAHNPQDPARTCGGSSGGSAAAVAAGIVPFALGSDTGGSVRQPAAFCGVVGTKPTYGRVSRWGMVEFAPSLDTFGLVTGNTEDAAILTGLLAGEDARDMTCRRLSAEDYTRALGSGVRGLRVGVIGDPGNTPAVAAMLRRASEVLAAGGAEVAAVSFPYHDTAAITYRVLAYAEGASTLSRYDGVRFGLPADGQTPEEQVTNARAKGFGYEVKRRVLFGALMASGENRERYLAAAQAVRDGIRAAFDRLFERFDLLLRATAPFGAFRLDTPLTTEQGCDMDYSTVCESLAGLPAMSVPFSRDENGMPLGLQIAAPQLCEGRMFAAGAYLEANR